MSTIEASVKPPIAVPETSPQSRARALRPLITELAWEAQRLRHLPKELAEPLFDAGLFRIWLPALYGGDNADVRTIVETLEEVSSADGSVGWNLMIGSQVNGMVAGGMPVELGREVFANPRLSMFGGGGPGTVQVRAVKDGHGGYRLWGGRSTFQSGCHNATWALPVGSIYEADGETQVLGADGRPIYRTFFVHRDEWTIEDTWDVGGLRASGSHDVVFNGSRVPSRFAEVQLVARPAVHENPIFRMTTGVRIVFSKTAVASGIAKGMMADFIELAGTKSPYLTSGLLRDRSLTQYRVAEAWALIESGRAWMLQAMQEMYDYLAETGAADATPEQIRNVRHACTFASESAVRAVDLLTDTAGSSANRTASPMERRLRDVKAVASHKWLAWPLMEDIGRDLLGIGGANPSLLG